MGFDGDLMSILREIIRFLENLHEVNLSLNMEQVRENLLMRSKDTLTKLMSNSRDIASPEPYLDMNAGSKGLTVPKENSLLEEYIGIEENISEKQHDYYETFQDIDISGHTMSVNIPRVPLTDSRDDDLTTESVLVTIYSGMSAAQTKSKCQMCGPLYRKEGKKLFVFEQYRSCWVGLVGSHLLIYGNERDNRPYVVQPIRGYKARASPNAIPRDPKRSESAFEIFRPGNRTLQFIARTPSDMEHWVTSICRVNSTEDKPEDLIEDVIATDGEIEEQEKLPKCEEAIVKVKEESYQNVATNIVEDVVTTEETVALSSEGNSNSGKEVLAESSRSSPPALPARIPRKLPSLPVRGSTSSYEPDEEEEDDIYHKIEDFRDCGRYQNVIKSEGKIDINNGGQLISYDDVRTAMKQSKILKDKGKQVNKSSELQRRSVECEMTYDDIASAVTRNNKVSREIRETLVSYDDVENLLSKAQSTKSKSEKGDETGKSPQKKSFLDRVRSRRESPRKTEKKAKRKTPTPPPISHEEISTYDDVSDLLNSSDIKPLEDDLPEYNCPPPPRPVYTKSIAINDSIETQDFYDDVGICREKYKEEMITDKNSQVLSEKQKIRNSVDLEVAPIENLQGALCEEGEHYQTPRKDAGRLDQVCIEQEELYDDVAILVDFTARQKRAMVKKDSEESRSLTSPEKKPWNRFVSTRKIRLTEPTDVTNRTCNGNEELDELHEHQGLIRMNTFQRLISKMENSLGKASTRATPALNKMNVPNST